MLEVEAKPVKAKGLLTGTVVRCMRQIAIWLSKHKGYGSHKDTRVCIDGYHHMKIQQTTTI